MKKEYETPELSVIEFEDQDIIITSGFLGEEDHLTSDPENEN